MSKPVCPKCNGKYSPPIVHCEYITDKSPEALKYNHTINKYEYERCPYCLGKNDYKNPTCALYQKYKEKNGKIVDKFGNEPELHDNAKVKDGYLVDKFGDKLMDKYQHYTTDLYCGTCG